MASLLHNLRTFFVGENAKVAVAVEEPTAAPTPSFLTAFNNDARISLYITFMVCVILVIIASLVVSGYDHDDVRMQPHTLYHSQSKFPLFHYFVHFSLAISVPVVLDMVMSYFLTESNCEQSSQPRDFARRFIMLAITLPNILIAAEVVPEASVDIVMFYQCTLCYLVIVYRIYSLSSTQKVVSFYPLQEISILLMLSIFAGFLYKLSLHGMIGGRLALKRIFLVLMIFSQFVALLKIVKWVKFSNRISQVAHKNIQSHKGTMHVLSIAVFLYLVMSVVDLVYYDHDVMFFPDRIESYYALEAVFCFVLLAWTAVRNFEVRKSEIANQKQLEYNRKMTRCISHEIRTPLNTAFMALDLLIDSLHSPIASLDAVDAYQKDMSEIADNIKEGCDISLSILNQLLTFEKLSSGMMQLENKLLGVDQLLESNMKLFKMQAQQLGINFKLDAGMLDPKSILVYVDRHKMDQVLRNLLSNAMKFTPKAGTVEVKVQWLHPNERNENISMLHKYHNSVSSLITDVAENNTSCCPVCSTKPAKHDTTRPLHEYVGDAQAYGTVLISIVDSGPGVSKEHQQKLFDEYVQINPGELQKGQGTGLGLPITKSIVQLHGGSVGMFSEGKGCGSTFYVELPAYRKSSSIHEHKDHHSLQSFVSNMSIMRSAPKLLRGNSYPEEVPNLEITAIINEQVDIEGGLHHNPVSPNNLSTSSPIEGGILRLVTDTLDTAVHPADNDPHGDVPQATSQHRRRRSTTPPKTQFRILLVDDSVPNRKMLTRLLQREGHSITEAGDGTEAVDIIRNKLNSQENENEKEEEVNDVEKKRGEYTAPFDFILMDYFMVKMNGPEAAAEIRKLGYQNPIVGVTGVVGNDSTEFVDAGADIVLSKPVTVQSIWKGLKSIKFF